VGENAGAQAKTAHKIHHHNTKTKGKRTMKYTETRTLLRNDIREICICRNWYMLGTNEEYENMMDLAAGDITTETLARIAQDIKDHSETGYAVQQIMAILADKVICTYTESAEDDEPPMTELDILYAAYCSVQEHLCSLWTRRKQQIDAGKPTNIADARLERLEEKIDYLHNRILELEAQEVR
jgi:hypothetical protein